MMRYQCWNQMSDEQQYRCRHDGALHPDEVPAGGLCSNEAVVGIEWKNDTRDRPRWYCLPCAIADVTDSRHA